MNDFWFSIERFKSLLPKSMDSRLNILSLVIVLITVILGLLGVKYFWLFGVVGILSVIAYREYNNQEDDDYETSEVDVPDYEKADPPHFYNGEIGDVMPYPCTKGGQATCSPDYETCDDIYYNPNPGIPNYGNTFDEIYGNVRDQVADSRFPNVNISGCRNAYFEGY